MKLFRLMGQIHLWLGVAFGVQVMLWLISGLVMVIIPIEEIRGEHLRHEVSERAIDWSDGALPLASIINAQTSEVVSARTGWLAGQPVWQLETGDGPVMIDARSGDSLSPISAELARNIALARQNGLGEISAISRIATPPVTFYINSQTGELRAVRTTAWRVYDVFWGIHIMDWSSRENFNSWWIKVTSIIAILFGLAGVYLTVHRLWMMGRRRKAERLGGVGS
jgi:hypothetical protein